MMAQSSSQRCPCRFVVLAVFVLWLGSPSLLIGESEQNDAAKQRQRAIIESWLSSQNAKMDGETLTDLARGILEESEKNALNPVLLLAVIKVESQFDHKAVSPRGAQGLMQVKPVVVAALIDEGKMDPRERHRNLKDPLVNVQVGASYLAYLREMFGDLKVALTAYNWGPTRVRKKIAAKQTIPLGYATKVLSVLRALEQQIALYEPVFPGVERAEVVAAG